MYNEFYLAHSGTLHETAQMDILAPEKTAPSGEKQSDFTPYLCPLKVRHGLLGSDSRQTKMAANEELAICLSPVDQASVVRRQVRSAYSSVHTLLLASARRRPADTTLF